MMQNHIKTPEDVLAFVADCNLATVEYMVMLKRRNKSEFERQISIAQVAYDWMKMFNVDYSGTRAEYIDKFDGSVEKWVNSYIESGIWNK